MTVSLLVLLVPSILNILTSDETRSTSVAIFTGAFMSVAAAAFSSCSETKVFALSTSSVHAFDVHCTSNAVVNLALPPGVERFFVSVLV